ncbi:histone deacetylase complex subunit SAP18 [Adelges cooleyi]|uniref:histone deacetylase complex subunit SAP18 n=1 Tax=Adelges cooleyi TaxID=133065 RepID=UPI00217FC52B|nr:histone deacetylase complex subunit SAP18 [Adelges cooleyi]XP_050428193.1 histone deacetylase complex subunit SAP18 [Adelges cooleyi]
MAAVESLVKVEEKPVNREKTCPLLLRVFCALGHHNNMAEYYRGAVPGNELQIYTWTDATLRELTGLIKEVNVESRARGTTFDFVLVTPEYSSPRFIGYEIGTTVAGNRSPGDLKTLANTRFTIGDYLDVCITPPENRFMRRPASMRYRN